MGMTVRSAGESDVAALLRLAEELIPGEAEPKQRECLLRSCIDDAKHDLYVAELEGRVIGFLDLWTFPDFVHGGVLTIIQNLVVDGAFRGRGVGDLLVRRAVRRAGERGALELHVWTEFDNKAAIRLYKKHGLTGESLLLEREF
ncbi:MAG: GNAT family N-acetyltransferase [Candidatus Bathyarchaeia archaeon]